MPEPEGFRSEPYRAPVPATLQGAQVIDAAQAVALLRSFKVMANKRPEYMALLQ